MFGNFTRTALDGAVWEHEVYFFYLLMLLCLKRLLGGLWKGILRDWASLAGAAAYGWYCAAVAAIVHNSVFFYRL